MPENRKNIQEIQTSIPAVWPSAILNLPCCSCFGSVNPSCISSLVKCFPTVRLPYHFQIHSSGYSFFFHFCLNYFRYLDLSSHAAHHCTGAPGQLFSYHSPWKEENIPCSQDLTFQFRVSNGGSS